jgi:squalene-hopene/tetraprenyl-beta-curcumene cyclase
MVYLQIALHALGYERDHPVIQRAERELDALFINDERTDSIRIQPCFSPVWDTGIALYAVTDCGMTVQDAAVNNAASWLREKECRHGGDWVQNLHGGRLVLKPTYGRGRKGREAPQGCWFFEYNNAWYPDCDDTAMVAMALKRAGGRENIEAAQRGVNWLLAMQNDDGGWAAFDKTTHRQYLEYIPFADHNAMQDPSCPDITGRVLECLSWHGFDNGHPAVRRAIEYIKSRQVVVPLVDGALSDGPALLNGESAQPHVDLRHNGHNGHGVGAPLNGHSAKRNGSEGAAGLKGGCWFGRWGVNYIYGTWQAVIGPIRCGEDPSQEWIQRAGRWIKSIQTSDGSFGESANSYEDESLKGQGASTASQTAWAAMILQEIYGPHDLDLQRAIQWLTSTQLTDAQAADPLINPDGDPAGSWAEFEFTGTGFPRVFYLRYHLYRLYFPLMALGRYAAALGVRPSAEPIFEMKPDKALAV